MEEVTKESKSCFSHGFTVPEETKSKLALPLSAPAIVTAPLRETADPYPPLPEDEDWDEYSEMGNIEGEIHYLHIYPDKGVRPRGDPSNGYVPLVTT
jgi:hypothetical protein